MSAIVGNYTFHFHIGTRSFVIKEGKYVISLLKAIQLLLKYNHLLLLQCGLTILSFFATLQLEIVLWQNIHKVVSHHSILKRK